MLTESVITDSSQRLTGLTDWLHLELRRIKAMYSSSAPASRSRASSLSNYHTARDQFDVSQENEVSTNIRIFIKNPPNTKWLLSAVPSCALHRIPSIIHAFDLRCDLGIQSLVRHWQAALLGSRRQVAHSFAIGCLREMEAQERVGQKC